MIELDHVPGLDSYRLLSGGVMNSTSEKARKHTDARDQDLPWHLYHSHSAWFGIRVLTQYDLDDIRSFRESIFHAPKDEAAKVVTAIQTVITFASDDFDGGHILKNYIP